MPSLTRFRITVLAILLLSALPLFAERIPFTLLQINDLYEITPVAGGKQGGMARLATLKKQLLRENPHTYMLLAGDAFSPSALGTAVVNGRPIAGEQIVATLNAAGLNYATFGNHEFDIPEPQFRARLAESKATWFSGNVRDAAGNQFPGVPDHVIFRVKGKQRTVRVGLIGITLNQTIKPWVSYKNALDTAMAEARQLRPQVDVLIALTHQAIADDQALATQVPELDMIIGGHEHENIQVWRGPHLTPITKADANVRTAYVHRLVYDTTARKLSVISELKKVDSSLPEDPATARLVSSWVKKAFDAFRQNGFDPTQVVATTTETLDGKEAHIRTGQTALTRLIADAMLHSVEGAEASLYNSGSIRIDDDLPPGPITQYDVIRVLPFGGRIVAVDMKGSLLSRILDAGWKNKGSGGWLEWSNIARAGDNWTIQGNPIDPARTYKIATTDFLLSGGERNIEFFTRQDPGVEKVIEHRDVRFAVIDELKRLQPRS